MDAFLQMKNNLLKSVVAQRITTMGRELCSDFDPTVSKTHELWHYDNLIHVQQLAWNAGDMWK